MVIVGSFGFGIMEVHLVLSLLLDSQVFQSCAFAHPENFRSYNFRHSIRSFKSQDSNPLASGHASPSMPRRKIRCILAWNNLDYGSSYRCPRSLSLCGNTRLQLHLLTVDYQKITIESSAFIGVRAMIMPGITIGKKAIVGANSVVTKNVKPTQIVAGNPAREIGLRKSQ